MEQPISELHLSSSSALVLCLRPRVPQSTLDANGCCLNAADMEVRENLAEELLENGLAGAGRGLEDEDEWDDGIVDRLKRELDEAKVQLEVLEATLADKVQKRKFAENGLQVCLSVCLSGILVFFYVCSRKYRNGLV